MRTPFVVILRRYLSLCALLFWQGGFTFYAAVVIPAAGRTLGQTLLHLRARITGEATNWLNGAGVVVLVLLLWDLACSVDAARWRSLGRGICWAVLFLSLAVLFALHYWMDVLSPADGTGPTDLATFNVLHSLYLWTSTAQWVAALGYLALAVSAWRAEDVKPDEQQGFTQGTVWGRTNGGRAPGKPVDREGITEEERGKKTEG
jgi:hypothetical protein